ncbi:MAG: HAD hydrolase family protein [Firmicutes bacterium]|nr:HAD hydrolase family protein [Bacillota bacterium]
MQIEIFGKGIIKIENAVFDYNGTIALNGKIDPKIKTMLIKLAKIMPVYVLTADTNQSAAGCCADLPINLKILTCDVVSTQTQKANIVAGLGLKNCVCFGNGFNDIEMFKIAGLSIAVLGEEGLCTKLLAHSDILVKSINDGIDLLFNTNRIVAGLRS